MKTGKEILILFCVFSFFFLLTAMSPNQAMGARAKKAEGKAKVPAANARFDVNKMGDMSDFDPSNPVIPTGDTIKIAVVGSFSGPGAALGEQYFTMVQWVAHDYNKRGGILVDGKKKLVQVFKADHMSRPDQCKKICEQMALQEKVHVLWGTNGSNLVKIMNETAEKYHIISQNMASLSDELMDATNFSRYAFMTMYSTSQVGKGFAYYYGQIRKKEKKFYIICQDYMFGHDLAESFKKGLKEYYPEAQIVGEDYHKLYLTDYAPYVTKIKASGAEVIFTGDWIPDAANLLKQTRQMGVKLPFAHIFLSDPNALSDIGVERSKGLVQLVGYQSDNPTFKTPENIKFYKMYNSKFKMSFKGTYTIDIGGAMEVYWLMSVIERAGSTDAEKIIKVWEGDAYQEENGQVFKMRACDHKVIEDMHINEFVPPEQQKVSFNIPPYYWSKDYSYFGPTHKIPAEKILPWMDPKLDRCKGKKESGD